MYASSYYYANGTVFSGSGGGSYGNADVATYLPTYAGNVNAAFYLGNGYYLTGITGSGYGDTNVAAYLSTANTRVIIGNTNTYNLQANTNQIVLGPTTILSTGNGSSTTNTNLLYNAYYDSAGALRYRTSQTGAMQMLFSSTGMTVAGTTAAVTGNAASAMTSWVTINGTALSTLNSIGITASGTLTTTGGTLASGSATGYLYNTTATSIYLGGAASSIYMGSSTGNVFVGNAVGSYNGNLIVRAFGLYNTLTLSSSQGGYNSPPYSAIALTGGSGTGMTASWSSVGGYVNGAVTVNNPGTGYRNGDVLTLPGGIGSTVILTNYNSNKSGNGLSDYTFTIDGTLLVPGNVIHPANSFILGDFTNSTFAFRTAFQTITANSSTGVYALPSGTSTGASWQALNNSNANNASKIFMATNANTDVQLGSGINGTGTYLPLSLYNNNAAQMVIYANGNVYMSNANPITTTGNVNVGNLNILSTGAMYGNVVSTGNVSVGNLVTFSTGSVYGNAAVATLTSAANGVGYMGMPQNSQSGSTYAVVIGDAGKHLYFTGATVTATIPANSSVAFPIGTTIAFIASSATTLTIAITTDTMYLGGTGTTGSRTLAAYGMATAVKVAATTWFISGTGLT